MRKLQQDSLFALEEKDEASAAPRERSYFLYTDGASKGNPGRAGIGVVIVDDEDVTLAEIAEDIGIATNNEAEYRALLRGLQEAFELQLPRLTWITDSELLARQWTGDYKIKAENLYPLYRQAKSLAQTFDLFKVQHTLRGGNKRADGLANKALKKPKAEP